MPRIFIYSPAYLRTLQRTNVSVFIHLCAALFIFLYFFSRDHAIGLTEYFIVALIAALFVAGRHFICQQYFKRQVVLINDKGLFKKCGKTIEKLIFRNVLRIQVWEDKEGEIAAVHLFTKDGNVKLHGIENMSRLLEDIRPYVGDLVVVNRKRHYFSNRFDFLPHLLIYVITAVITVLYIYVPSFHEWLHYAIWLLPALILSYGRPLSKLFGKALYKWECLVAFVLIGLFIYQL